MKLIQIVFWIPAASTIEKYKARSLIKQRIFISSADGMCLVV